jgi:hypothetical protein
VRKCAKQPRIGLRLPGRLAARREAFDEALLAASKLDDADGIIRARSNKAFALAYMARDKTKPGLSGFVLDKGSDAYRQAKENLALAVAKAREAGWPDERLCGMWSDLARSAGLYRGDRRGPRAVKRWERTGRGGLNPGRRRASGPDYPHPGVEALDRVSRSTG